MPPCAISSQGRKPIFNVGTGESRSFNDVANAWISVLGGGEISYVPFPQELEGKYQNFTEADISALRAAGYTTLFTTLGNGMSLFDEDGLVTHLPTFARAVYDVTGTLALALATGAKLADCARIANVAAGVVVGKVGTAVLTAEELQSSLGRSGT